ncbi:MAG: hypothetical protein M1828_005784 [Chrysothrix sp. TS-e1954]|nr:MAG: hypothetical protein M1828_005784 [Chrysothrix sp. TS-e1954]
MDAPSLPETTISPNHSTVNGEPADLEYNSIKGFSYTLTGEQFDRRTVTHPPSRLVVLYLHTLTRPTADSQQYDLVCVVDRLDHELFPDEPGSRSPQPEIPYTVCLLLTEPPMQLVASPLFSRHHLLGPQSSFSKINVIISTLSGSQHAKDIFTHLLQPFLKGQGLVTTVDGQEKMLYDVHETTSPNTIAEKTHTIFHPLAANPLLGTREKQLIFLISGDGGISDLVNALASPPSGHSVEERRRAKLARRHYVPPTVLLIPAGTGNALANSTRILDPSSPPNDETYGLRTLAQGEPRSLPAVSVTFSPPARPYVPPDSDPPLSNEEITQVTAVVVVSWGLHAALVSDSDTPSFRKHGNARFSMAASANLQPEPHHYRGRLSILKPSSLKLSKDEFQDPWTDLPSTSHAYVLATLCSHLQSNFCISPRSTPLSNELHLVHFGPPRISSAEEIMSVMHAAFEGGKHVDMDGVGYSDVEGVRLVIQEEDERWRRVCVDGRILVVPRGGSVEIRKRGGRPLVEIVAAEDGRDVMHGLGYRWS